MSLSSFEIENSRCEVINECVGLRLMIVKRSAQLDSNSFDAIIHILFHSADTSLPVGHAKIQLLEAIVKLLKVANSPMELITDRPSSSLV